MISAKFSTFPSAFFFTYLNGLLLSHRGKHVGMYETIPERSYALYTGTDDRHIDEKSKPQFINYGIKKRYFLQGLYLSKSQGQRYKQIITRGVDRWLTNGLT